MANADSKEGLGGIRLELENEPLASPFGPKFLIHNYGHGGAGITLSFGCAGVVPDHVETLIKQMRPTRTRPSVAVIGSGVTGLTVASEVRRKWPGLPVTVYAKELDVRWTTSFKVGGQFEPAGIYEEYETQEQRDVLADYLRRSRDRIVELSDSSLWCRYSIALRRNYTLDHRNPGFDVFIPLDVVPRPRVGMLPFRSLNTVGREYRTWLINPTILLPHLAGDLRRQGVRFRRRAFADKQALCRLRENIIVNSRGVRAIEVRGVGGGPCTGARSVFSTSLTSSIIRPTGAWPRCRPSFLDRQHFNFRSMPNEASPQTDEPCMMASTQRTARLDLRRIPHDGQITAWLAKSV